MRDIDKTIKFGCYLCVLVAICGMAYRATIYWSIPVVKGEPYGLGDILDLGFFLLLLFFAAITFVFSFFKFVFGNNNFAKLYIAGLLTSAISVIAFHYIHPLVPRLW